VAGRCVHTPISCPTCKVCAGGQCVADQAQEGTACGDDGNTCTDNVCRAGECRAEVALGRNCDDSNACTVNDVCQADGRCAGQPMACKACNACDGGTCAPVETDPRCTTCCNGNCCADGETCVDDECQQVCLHPGDICSDSSACCPDEPVECRVSRGCDPDGAPLFRCCHPTGGTCRQTCECCGGNKCEDQRCCAEQGSTCTSDNQCCDQSNPDNNGLTHSMVCRDNTCTPCTGIPGTCSTNDECCSGQCNASACCEPHGAAVKVVGPLAGCCDTPLYQGDGAVCSPCRGKDDTCFTDPVTNNNNCCFGPRGQYSCVGGKCVDN
jgi:hypothetical protein